MKLNLIFLSIFVLLISCEKDHEAPKSATKKSIFEVSTSMNSVINGLDSYEENIITFSDDLIIEGYVVSSDKAGNYYNELILQDKPENPTTGIALQIDESSLFERFPFGSKIYIQLNGLSIGYQNGIIKIGRLNESEIETLTEFLIDQHVFRSNEIFNIIPLNINLSTLNSNYLNLYLGLDQMQFSKAFLEPTPKTLAAESTDSFDGLRPILNCESKLELMLSTSVFSNFKTMTLPSSSGSITGVLTRDYDNLHYVLKMNSASDINFLNESRCDYEYFECNPTTLEFEEANILFDQDFEEITNENLLEPLGWLNTNITGDEKRWTDKKITNIDNRVLTLSAFNSNLQPLHAWLITPEINLTGITKVYLQFRVRTLYNNGDALKVWVTDDFSGDIKTTDWKLFNIDLPKSSSNYVTIKKDISCLTSVIRIGFEYKGYDSILTSTYDIDDIIISTEAND